MKKPLARFTADLNLGPLSLAQVAWSIAEFLLLCLAFGVILWALL